VRNNDLTPHTPYLYSLPKGEPIFDEYRGFSPKMLSKFGVYLCTDASFWDGRYEEDGTPLLTEQYNKRYIIPLYNELGELAGFQARASEDWQKPKYLFSSGIQAAKLLYNYDKAQGSHVLFVVEGVFGVMNFIKHATTNVVAMIGSELTPKKRALLKGHRLVLCLDDDDAGMRCMNHMEDDEELDIAERIFLPPGAEYDRMGVDQFIRLRELAWTNTDNHGIISLGDKQ
jgi:DNA primase